MTKKESRKLIEEAQALIFKIEEALSKDQYDPVRQQGYRARIAIGTLDNWIREARQESDISISTSVIEVTKEGIYLDTRGNLVKVFNVGGSIPYFRAVQCGAYYDVNREEGKSYKHGDLWEMSHFVRDFKDSDLVVDKVEEKI